MKKNNTEPNESVNNPILFSLFHLAQRLKSLESEVFEHGPNYLNFLGSTQWARAALLQKSGPPT